MSNKSKAVGTYRPLEPKWRGQILNEFDLRLTRLERLKVFIGYKIKLKYESPTLHMPGQMRPTMSVQVVNED